MELVQVNFFGRTGKPWRVEKLHHGYAWSSHPGDYINSPPHWIETGLVVVAKTAQGAYIRAATITGSSKIRVTEEIE